MDRLFSFFLAMLAVIALLVGGGVFAEPITRLIRRRAPGFSYEGEAFLLQGLMVVAAFAFGMVAIYLLSRP